MAEEGVDPATGFSYETFDLTHAKISQSHIASRLTTGPKDESGRFRVTKGMSSLSAAEDVNPKNKGVTLLDPTKAISCNTVKRFAEDPAPPGGGGGGGKKAKKTRGKDERGGGGGGEDDKKKAKASWLCVGLVVKIIDKSLKEVQGGFYKKKGVVRRIIAPGTAEVEVMGAAAQAGAAEVEAVLVSVRERDLETVLPAPGKTVRVVKGEHVGATGELRAVHEKRFLAEVAVDAGVRQRVEFLQYDEVCKVHR